MKTSIQLDKELSAEVKRVVWLVGERPATVLRMAIRAGLPLVVARSSVPLPDGHFALAYKRVNRAKFERSVGRRTLQRRER